MDTGLENICSFLRECSCVEDMQELDDLLAGFQSRLNTRMKISVLSASVQIDSGKRVVGQAMPNRLWQLALKGQECAHAKFFCLGTFKNAETTPNLCQQINCFSCSFIHISITKSQITDIHEDLFIYKSPSYSGEHIDHLVVGSTVLNQNSTASSINQGGTWDIFQILAPHIWLTASRCKTLVDSRQSKAADQLSSRELEILSYAAQGLSNYAIARQVQISRWTAKAHMSNILKKLHAGSRVEAVVQGVKLGLVRLADK